MSMACLYSIVAYGERPDALAGTLEEALDEVDRIDRLMSHYRADSPLSRINRKAARRPVEVEPELFQFLQASLRYSVESDGAFDITVGPLMKAWGFFRGDGRVPGDREIDRLRDRIGYRHVILDAERRTVRFDRPGVELDLGGIAKGYAVDRVVALLTRRNVAAALVNAGGSTIYGLGAPPGLAAWDVEIEDPLDAREVAFTVPLRNRALSVSGTGEESFEVDGVRYTHIMDPRTGRPARGALSVIVLATNGTTGDALDDALFVQGVEQAEALLRAHPESEAFFLLDDPPDAWRVVHLPASSAVRLSGELR